MGKNVIQQKITLLNRLIETYDKIVRVQKFQIHELQERIHQLEKGDANS